MVKKAVDEKSVASKNTSANSSVKPVTQPAASPALKPYQGVTTISKWEKQEFGPITVPPTVKQHPVGSPEANPNEEVKDTSEAIPKNDTDVKTKNETEGIAKNESIAILAH